jgi:hypothetical protein
MPEVRRHVCFVPFFHGHLFSFVFLILEMADRTWADPVSVIPELGLPGSGYHLQGRSRPHHTTDGLSKLHSYESF